MFLLPAFLILLQPDAGSALVFFSFLLLFYMVGANQLYYVIGIGFITLIILSLIYEPLYVGTAAGVLSVVSLCYFRPINTWLLVASLSLVPLSFIAYNYGFFNYYLWGLLAFLIGIIAYNINLSRYTRSSLTGLILSVTIFLDRPTAP